jgi:LCP family protein required for cell wall assembly
MLDSITPPKGFKKIFKRHDHGRENEIHENMPKKFNKKKLIIWSIIIIILIVPTFYLFKTGSAFSKIITIKNIAWEKIFGKLPDTEYTPPKDENRVNFLLLGIRGDDEPGAGAWLTDAIMIISMEKDTRNVALISLPRDLYLQMPGEVAYEKINTVYAVGNKKYNSGLDYAKKTLAYVTGLYIDYAVEINFDAFKDIVEILGGVTISLDKPFTESNQWGCDAMGKNCMVFKIDAGEQTLNGESALLYVRSRFSSSDFERIRRQQQVIIALKDKILSLGILIDPLKVSGIIDILSKNIQTDVSPWQIPELIDLAKKAKTDNIIRKVFENSPEGMLYESKIDGMYVLLPTDTTFKNIREACQNIFKQN